MEQVKSERLKKCSKCGAMFSYEMFDFNRRVSVGGNGLFFRRSECKNCRKEERVQNNILGIKQYPKLKNYSSGQNSEYNKKRRHLPQIQYHEYKGNAKKRNIYFELNLDFFKSINKASCYYCGIKPQEKEAMGVDRLDNNQGYVKENCVPCCTDCNRAKLAKTEEQFIEHCRRVVNHTNNKKCYLSLIPSPQ